MGAMRGSRVTGVGFCGLYFCVRRLRRSALEVTKVENGSYRLSHTFRLPMLIRARVGPYCASTTISMILVIGSTRKRLSKSLGAAWAACTLERCRRESQPDPEKVRTSTYIVFPPIEWPTPTNRRRCIGRSGTYSSCSGILAPTSGMQ